MRAWTGNVTNAHCGHACCINISLDSISAWDLGSFDISIIKILAVLFKIASKDQINTGTLQWKLDKTFIDLGPSNCNSVR